MNKSEKEEFIDFCLEMLCDDMAYDIDFTAVPNFKYMIRMLVETTDSTEEKVIEGLERWRSGVYRRNG
jgi:hypothetical protein